MCGKDTHYFRNGKGKGRFFVCLVNPYLQLMTPLLVDSVFLQDSRAAGAVAQAHDGTVNAEVGLALVLQLVVVRLACQILCRVGQCREREGAFYGLNAQALP